MGRLRQRGVLVVLLLLLVVNLPLLHGAWVGRQIDRDGVDATAEVLTVTDRSGDGGLLELRFDADLDPAQRTWQAAVGQDALERAEETGTIGVRVVPGEPARYRVEGQQGAGILLALTVFADVVLVLALLLMLRRRSGPMRLVALEDVRRARPGGRLDQLSPTEYLVVGEVAVREPGVVELDAGGRRVRIELAGFENLVGYEQPAQVRCRLPDSPA